MTSVPTFDSDRAVHDRYSAGARSAQADLCCAVSYDPAYLEVIPPEVLERDYGCGDPTQHVKSGDTVLDLGSGGGKACFIASQIVGPSGRVIGVDVNEEMLELARRHVDGVGDRIGWHNVSLRRGNIEDLALDLDQLDRWLAEHPVTKARDVAALEAERIRLRSEFPMIPDQSVDVVMSNCVLNLVRDEQKARLFSEIFRVLKSGGRAVISDIVADEPVPDELKRDADLWSGCVSGAMTETAFLESFVRVGFYGIEIVARNAEPWRTVHGIEFRSVTVRAFRGKEGDCLESNKALVYRGPWRQVADDDGHVFRRGVREAVCEKTFQIMNRDPYRGHFDAVLPLASVPETEWRSFDCARRSPRHPRETKGVEHNVTTEAKSDPCGDGSCC